MTIDRAVTILNEVGIDVYKVDGMDNTYQVWDDMFLRAERLNEEQVIELAKRFSGE